MLTETAFESFKKFIENHIAYAQVEYDGELHKAKIESRERLNDGRVALSISVTPEKSKGTDITKVQLYDIGNKLFAEKEEKIHLAGAQQGILYRFTFNFREEGI